MLNADIVSRVKELIDGSQTILVIFPSDAKDDVKLAAASFYLCLNQIEGKDNSILTQMQDAGLKMQDKNVVGLENLRTTLGNRNLQISFPYNETQVDKVSYDIDEETGRFYLLVQPQKTAKPLDYKQVEYAYTGTEADLIFLVGVTDLESLGLLYQDHEQVYQDASTISINNYEANFANINIDGSGKNGLSETMFDLISQMQLSLPVDAASNLLRGIEESTEYLQSLTTTADTFEAVAKLMRMGARRSKKTNNPEPITHSEIKKTVPRPEKKKNKTLVQNQKIEPTGGLNYQPSKLRQ